MERYRRKKSGKVSGSGGANKSDKLVVLHDMLVVGCKHAPFVILLSDMIKKYTEK